MNVQVALVALVASDRMISEASYIEGTIGTKIKKCVASFRFSMFHLLHQ